MNTNKDLRSTLFKTLDDFLNGRISSENAKTIALLAQQYIKAQKQNIKISHINGELK